MFFLTACPILAVDLQPSLPVEHFGSFDSGEAVFSDSHNNSVLPSPQNLEIQDVLNETRFESHSTHYKQAFGTHVLQASSLI